MKLSELKKGVCELEKRDKVLRGIIKQAEVMTLKPDTRRTLFISLAQSIIFQQLHAKAATTILNRLQALFLGKVLEPKRLLRLAPLTLRRVGVSRNKMLALRDLAKKQVDGHLPDHRKLNKMSDAEIVEQLTQIRGIGPWTVHMHLIFRMGRLDVLPSTDFGVRNGFRIAYKKRSMPSPKQLEVFGENWRPYRSVAAWYLWRAADQQE